MKQAELQHKIRIFTRNGKSDEAQAVLAGIGYDPPALDAAIERLQNWRRSRRQVQSLLAAQKRATQAEREAYLAARNAATKFKRTARLLFKGNEPVLTELGLYPPLHSSNGNGHTNGATPANGSDGSLAEPAYSNGNGQRSRPSFSTAATIDRWQMLFEKALDLAAEHQTLLAQRGWPAGEITSALSLVETYAGADIDQQQKVKSYRKALAETAAAAVELRDWYQTARGLTRAALAGLPPEEQAELKKLLGL